MKLETFEYDGTIYNIKIGRSATENTELVQNANKSDIWFHLSDSPSCHVILQCETRLNEVPRQVISRCAYLCKMHSKTPRKLRMCRPPEYPAKLSQPIAKLYIPVNCL